MYLRGVSVKRLLHHNGRITLSRGWRYSGGGITAAKDFANTFYDSRKATKVKSLKTCYKLLMNSVIGRFSMSPKAPARAGLFPTYDHYYKTGGFFI